MSVQFAVSTTDNIHFTGMTCFPLQFSRLARTSIRRSVALVRSGPPLETAIAPLRGRRKDRQRRRQSSLSVMNAGDQACPETRPCPHPSSGSRKDRKSTRLNSSHGYISYAVFCLKKKTTSDMPSDNTHKNT